ncbi:putative Ig domain-containing protein [Glycomyces sp. L485]|uniref:discoidin domain-containing protein n=1 Tax=Glycomyces sp. L485 TaxID=2909235 RepID=UPI001F4BCB4A|nr:discoidin domain-containing protein [Glycomyces sp. L485]MCH7229440.1 putative Ig domain-containing protein [Glycomyces sp. L485]
MIPLRAALRGPSSIPKRALALAAALALSLGLLQFAPGAAKPVTAQETAACEVQIHSTTSEAGFNHPGVGLTEPILENVRDQLAAGAEPWASSFEALKSHSAAGENVGSSNAGSDPTKPASDAFNSQGFNGRFRADGQKAYTQAVMYVLTGKEVHRENALGILRIWSQMDPAKYEYFTDSHIHTGVPLFRMASAAELLRYTSCGEDEAYPWTDADTQALTENLILPSIATFMSSPDHFMNQHNYPLMGSMAGAIFMDDKALYEEKVEWFTVNSTAEDRGFNGSIKWLLRWVDKNDQTGEPIEDPHVQHVEMGRDQAHGGGDLTNFAVLSRMLLAQGTEVDPVDGTVSTAEDAVGPYEFLDDRILGAADYFWQFMLGHDPEWTPVGYAISPDGTIRDTYNHISDSYRGRYATASFWEIYYHYKFTRGMDLDATAPFLAEAYAKRPGPLYYRGGALGNAWGGYDGEGDSWLFAPAEAAGDSTPPLGDDPDIHEVEERYTHLAGDVETGEGYVSMADGSKIAYLSGATNRPKLGFLVRTEGEAVIHLGGASHDDTVKRDRTLLVPDTGGEWRYVTADRSMGDILFIETEGATVDIDHINIDAEADLTGPVFAADAADRVVTWSGADVTADLSATAAEGTTYTATGLPEDADLDPDTGALTWTPDGSGTWAVTVAADDGTNAAARRVTFAVAGDRRGAIGLAEDGLDLEDGYESATEAAFTAAHETAEDLRKKGSDAEYLAALADLVAAVEGLRLISPTSDLDGGLDYAGLVESSTAGGRIGLLTDGNNQTGVWYGQAVNLSHTFDFGPDFRVSASEFGFQSNIFSDRLANSAVFGSDDGTDWTRLTPEVTEFTQDFHTLEVDPELTDDHFRYIKVKMLEPLPDVLYGTVRGLFEMTEFRIYGERHEIGNLIESATITSDDAVAGKIAIGDTVTVAATTKEPIDSLSVNVKGISAAATSDDGVNWIAPVVLDDVEPGTVSLAVDYTDANGQPGPTYYGTADDESLYVGGDRDHWIDVADLATVTASDKQWPGNGLSADEVGYLLFDGDAETAGDLVTGEGSYYTVDFGEGASVRLDEAFLLPRDCCVSRAEGTIVQGSDDGQTWTDLTEPLSDPVSGVWSRSAVTGDAHYRYLRIINPNRWHGNLSEAQFFGDFTYDDAYLEAKVRDTGDSTRASAYLYEEEVARIREALAAEDPDRIALLNDLLAAAALLVPQSTLFPEVEVDPAGVVASSVAWDDSVDAAGNGRRAFDDDPATSPDTKTAEGWVQADLGEDGAVALSAVEFLPRSGNHLRANGAQILGSNDGQTWEALATISGVTAAEWGAVPIESTTEYRYLRYYTPNGHANVAELVFIERAVDDTLIDLLLDRAALLNEADWTPESWGALADAVTDGESLAADDAATQSDVDAAADALDAAIGALVWNVPDWDEPTQYTAGARVQYEGAVYVAQWSTHGQVPGESPYSAWAEVGEALFCGGDRLTRWTPSTVYEEGDEAVHDGVRWRARWWSRNQEPGTAGVWERLGDC